MLISVLKIDFIAYFFLNYCKEIGNLFWVIWACITHRHKMILSTRRKISCLSAHKKSAYPKRFSGDNTKICKLLILCTLRMLGYVRTSKMTESTCRNLQCLSACQNYTSLFTSFLRYYILKNPGI